MVILVKLEQPEKADFPIAVTPSGMVILVKLEQREKAYSPIAVTPSQNLLGFSSKILISILLPLIKHPFQLS